MSEDIAIADDVIVVITEPEQHLAAVSCHDVIGTS